jgi:genetic interactor of prohibitins 3, mitochondrial
MSICTRRSALNSVSRSLHPSSFVPLFLCPALINRTSDASIRQSRQATQRRSFSQCLALRTGTRVVETPEGHHFDPVQTALERVPRVCPGCGAHSQTSAPEEAGYYGSWSRNKPKLVTASKDESRSNLEFEIFQSAMERADVEILKELGGESAMTENGEQLGLLFLIPNHNC